jgi:hypothetical protein
MSFRGINAASGVQWQEQAASETEGWHRLDIQEKLYVDVSSSPDRALSQGQVFH